ncbi:MAG: hypothetical protein JO156_07085 [Solirubrobacterales bacterium]|nr:hypothetical protein [Solirubrobacterales bacterium]
MATLEQISAALNGVQSVGQARAAIGAALTAIHDAYDTANGLPYFSGYNTAAATRELDSNRYALEGDYKALPQGDNTAIDRSKWAPMQNDVNRAYVSIAGVLGGVAGAPTISDVGDILVQSIKEAPGVFLEYVGKATGAVLETATEAAGKGIMGFVKAAWPLLLVVAIVLIVASKQSGKSPVALVAGLVRGGVPL